MSETGASTARILRLLDGIDVSALDPLERVLLVTDGTVTEALEAMFLERIDLVKVEQKITPAGAAHRLLDPRDGETMIERKIMLRGARSGRNYVYAESFIAVDRLSPEFRKGLLESDLPLGRLWLEYRLETFKEFVDVRYADCEGLPARFEFDRTNALARTYRVYSGGQPVILITEHFSAGLGLLNGAKSGIS